MGPSAFSAASIQSAACSGSVSSCVATNVLIPSSLAIFMSAPPTWLAVSPPQAARTIVDGIARRAPWVVFGIEKLGWCRAFEKYLGAAPAHFRRRR